MYVRNPKVEEAPLQGELMLFNSESSQFYLLNPTMAFIWRRCGDEMSVAALIDAMASAFDGVDASSAEADIRAGLDDLVKLGLLLDAATQSR